MVITILSGSNHEGSTTGKLCRYMQSCFEAAGHQVLLFDIAERPLPVFSEKGSYDEDENVGTLRSWVAEGQAIVLATPEYHGSLSGALKNSIDFLWPQFDGKPVLSASVAGGPVGVSSLLHLQSIVRNVHAINSPEWVSLGGPDRAFSDAGEPENPKMRERIQKACNYLLKLAESLA